MTVAHHTYGIYAVLLKQPNPPLVIQQRALELAKASASGNDLAVQLCQLNDLDEDIDKALGKINRAPVVTAWASRPGRSPEEIATRFSKERRVSVLLALAEREDLPRSVSATITQYVSNIEVAEKLVLNESLPIEQRATAFVRAMDKNIRGRSQRIVESKQSSLQNVVSDEVLLYALSATPPAQMTMLTVMAGLLRGVPLTESQLAVALKEIHGRFHEFAEFMQRYSGFNYRPPIPGDVIRSATAVLENDSCTVEVAEQLRDIVLEFEASVNNSTTAELHGLKSGVPAHAQTAADVNTYGPSMVDQLMDKIARKERVLSPDLAVQIMNAPWMDERIAHLLRGSAQVALFDRIAASAVTVLEPELAAELFGARFVPTDEHFDCADDPAEYFNRYFAALTFSGVLSSAYAHVIALKLAGSRHFCDDTLLGLSVAVAFRMSSAEPALEQRFARCLLDSIGDDESVWRVFETLIAESDIELRDAIDASIALCSAQS